MALEKQAPHKYPPQVMLKYLIVVGSTHKPFFMEILEEFHGVLEEFLKPG